MWLVLQIVAASVDKSSVDVWEGSDLKKGVKSQGLWALSVVMAGSAVDNLRGGYTIFFPRKT